MRRRKGFGKLYKKNLSILCEFFPPLRLKESKLAINHFADTYIIRYIFPAIEQYVVYFYFERKVSFRHNIHSIILIINSMFRKSLIIISIFFGLFLYTCGVGVEDVSPDEAELSKKDVINENLDDVLAELHLQIQKLKAEMDYHYEDLAEVKAQTKIWANPFAIYNKEIVLENGSSIFGKIIYQDQDIMKVETLIGQLNINRNTIVRVVNQIGSDNKFGTDNSNSAVSNVIENADASGINLIQKQAQLQSAKLVLVGDISEEKDNSGNTVLKGEVKNVGNKRADFAKIIFTFRMNWQGETKSLTAFINGVTNTFNTGISSDNSILPHAVGNFELIIPQSFGNFIGYSYDIDWSQYEN